MDSEEIQWEDDLLITGDVARAVEENEFVPYLQPVFHLATGTVAGGEALVRWTLADDGTVVPAALFVPSLERTNTICGLDWFMIDEICSFAAQLGASGQGMPLSLNISAQHATDGDFAVRLAASADWRKVPHEQLRVELSERVVATGLANELIASTQEQGFTVVVDNVATGAEGVRTLAGQGLHAIKVSRVFWAEASDDELATMVRVAAELGVAISAEGVESEQELERLKTAGFGYAQGYFLARPMDTSAFAERLKG